MRIRAAAFSLALALCGADGASQEMLRSQYPLALIYGTAKPCDGAFFWKKEIIPDVSISALRLSRKVHWFQAEVDHLVYVPAVGVGVSSRLRTGLFDAAGALFHIDAEVEAEGVLRIDEGADGTVERLYGIHIKAKSEGAVFRDLLGPVVRYARAAQEGDQLRALYEMMDTDTSIVRRIEVIPPEERLAHGAAIRRGRMLMSCDENGY